MLVTFALLPQHRELSLPCVAARMREAEEVEGLQAVRRPAVVHHCRTSMDLTMRPAMLVIAGNRGTSRFPNAVRPCMPGVSDRAGSRRALRERRVEYGLPPTYTASAPRRGHGSRRGSSFSRLNTRPARPPVNASPNRATPVDA
jgi:hypothetical protein